MTGVSKAVLVLPTLEECYRSHFSPPQDSERSPCSGGGRMLARSAGGSLHTLPSAPALLWPITAARTALQCVLQRALPGQVITWTHAFWLNGYD